MSSAGARETIVRRIDGLPADFEGLVIASEDEGFRFLARLRDEWTAGRGRFDRSGEALFEARIAARLVGVCGLSHDPYAPEPGLGRVRHLYVQPEARRAGVGRSLVTAVVDHARGRFDRLRLRTDTTDADRFYRAIGFTPTPGEPDSTHALVLGE